MTECSPLVDAASPKATAALARRLGAVLRAGDCVTLEGPIGAGKTHFARALIRSLMTTPEDVPSPTFTLVQTYDTEAGEIWHADLYRLTGPAEIEDLGLSEAFDSAICLIEWPDRLGPLMPRQALHLHLAPDPDDEDRRRIGFHWTGGDWAARLGTVLND